VLCEVASGASDKQNRNYFRSHYAEKERATRPTAGREGERAISAQRIGIKEVFLERSGRKIWVRHEPSAEPFIPCYTPRAKRSVARAQRGATERSEFKKYFSINIILIVFFFSKINLFFVLGEGQRGIKGVNARSPKPLNGLVQQSIFFD
jgi:hypothetical protein